MSSCSTKVRVYSGLTASSANQELIVKFLFTLNPTSFFGFY
jgi:hypothetical protein